MGTGGSGGAPVPFGAGYCGEEERRVAEGRGEAFVRLACRLWDDRPFRDSDMPGSWGSDESLCNADAVRSRASAYRSNVQHLRLLFHRTNRPL